MLSDNPDDCPIDLEVYLIRDDVRWYAGAVFGALHGKSDNEVIQFVQETLIKDRQVEASPELRKRAWSLVSKHLTDSVDPKVIRYFKRRLMEA